MWPFKKKKVEAAVPAIVETAPPVAKPVKAKTKTKRVKKPKIEPRIDIVKVDIDPTNPRLGAFELDWNDEFIALLRKSGYTGSSEEEIVDRWMTDLCRSVAADDVAAIPDHTNVQIGRRDLGNGRTEMF